MRAPVASYVPVRSPVHRAPLVVRAGLPLAVTVLAVLLPGAAAGTALLGAAVLWWAASRVPVRRAASDLRVPGVVLATIFAYHWWRSGWTATGAATAWGVCAGLAAAVLACFVMTWTTRPADLFDGVARAGRRIGLGRPAARLGFAISLVLVTLPALERVRVETRDAAAARGRGRDVRAQVAPVVVRTVGHALQLGEALAARGLDDPGRTSPAGEDPS